MSALGIDVARYQDPDKLPWAAWLTVAPVCIIQTYHGDHIEPRATGHLAAAARAGYQHIGAYAWLYGGNGAAQCASFLGTLTGAHTFAALDIEQAGVSAADVTTWCAYFDAHGPSLPLVLYGNNTLAAIVAAHPELRKYGVWWAAYPTYPNEASAPPFARPRDVPAGLHIVGWQYAGNNGRLAPYGGEIDLSVWYEIPGAQPMPAEFPRTATGPKLGIHSISPGNTLALVQRAVDRGWRWPVVKILHDASVCADVKRISPKTLTICRYMPDSGDEGLQDVDTWSTTQMVDWAARLIDLIFARTSAAHLAATDYFDVTNEPGAHGVAYYRALGLAFCELVKQADARGVHLSLPALPQGVPEWDEMIALVDTGLFGLMKKGGHIFDVHEGVFTDQPIDFGWGDIIPGGPAVPGAGSTNFRHRYLYSLLALRGEVVPLVISEFYGGGRYSDSPASQLARFRWYDVRARAEPYLLAFLPFTINPDATWRDEDYGPTYASPELWAYVAAERSLPNATGDDTMDTQKALDAIRAAQASLTQAADALAPTWKAGDVAVAVANPLQLYTAVHTTSGLPRPDYTSDIDVFEVSADGAWLKVFQVPALYVRAADVRHK